MTQTLKNTQPMTTSAPVMLVTGSAKRIGAAIVRAAHRHGYRVIIHCHHSEQEANALADELNDTCAHSAVVIIADLAVVNQGDTLKNLTQTIMQAFGQLDILVHNASRFYPTPLGSIRHDQWDELLLTNAKAPLLLSQALYPYLKMQQGCIISLLDIHAHDKPFTNYTVYNMAKAAHRMMVQSLALDMAPNVRVNGVAPGVNILPDADSDQALDSQQQKSIVDSIPMQRIGTPADIAHSVLYLAQASYVTGEIITVDGGRSLTLAGGN
ncbi:possible Short-chain dehydrogenase/reductase SDR [Psychrobacter arcticus 273-4]|uniref:Possible Short-chain dehydrogenase/reductase SDR n=1 Tax=Psychrobacter arcticus (strain DSM 17307 / VKM B-2377 / 273-4) TaxID=259536 RepID=Q4FRZ1_PSYA2|nr:pteridine reductase [Psychrobacter arcticus]AAZ19217.1 possible Short-chain dehydrogenase/reductase SDR [Psychrobacter arcticus 273-4]